MLQTREQEDWTLRGIPTCCQDNAMCVSFVSVIERTQMGVGSSRGECSNTFLELLKQGATAQVVYTVQ